MKLKSIPGQYRFNSTMQVVQEPRQMTEEEKIRYNRLVEHCYQMTIFDFISWSFPNEKNV